MSQSGTAVPVEDKNKKTNANYVGDMVALESHIEETLDRQLQGVKVDPAALAAVKEFHTLVKTQRDRMKSLQEEIGTTVGNPVIKFGSAFLGKAAGVIDKTRTEGSSKSLRDDYAAFNLAAIGYTILFTTATAHASPQPFLRELAELDWHPARRLAPYRPRRKRRRDGTQERLPVPEPDERAG